MNPFSAQGLQTEIYTKGFTGQSPPFPFNYRELEMLVKAKLTKEAFSYIAGGAGYEDTMANNRSGFQDWKIVPRMLRDVSNCTLGINLFGQQLNSPILLSPIGVLELAHKEAEIPVAKAAANYGVPMIFSNQASVAMEQVAANLGDSPRWFQLYWSKSNDLVASLVSRAEACGCSAIVVTLDTTMLGWRPRDLDVAYLPFLEGKGLAQYLTDPVFQRLMDEPVGEEGASLKLKPNFKTIRSVMRLMRSYPAPFMENLRSRRPINAVKKFTEIYTNSALNWEDLKFLRERTKLPILLKGILHPKDAQMAIDYGMDGILVSNHGGRQVDGSIGSIEALPGIVEAIKDQVPVLIDSGFRNGTDIFKALALGAKAVCIGRPYVYGLAVAGQAGVEEIIRRLMAEFELTMRLSGCQSIEEINIDCLAAKK